jgi:RNA polymerase sigma-B factor
MTKAPRTAEPPVLPRQISRRGERPTVARTDLPEQTTLTDRDRPTHTAHADLAVLAAMAPDDPDRPGLRARLVEQHIPVVRALAGRYRHLGEPFDDLVQVGTIGLIEAIDRFDPDRGVPLVGYATPVILGEIRRHLRDLASTVRVPRQVHEVQQRVAVATAELSQRLQRAPTTAEIARDSGVDLDLVLEALEVRRARTTVPLEAMSPDGGGGLGAGATDGRVAGSHRTDPALVHDETELDDVLHREALRPALALLDEREKRILVLRFFRGLSQREIAGQLGISQMHVSRLLARTLQRIKTQITVSGD